MREALDFHSKWLLYHVLGNKKSRWWLEAFLGQKTNGTKREETGQGVPLFFSALLAKAEMADKLYLLVCLCRLIGTGCLESCVEKDSQISGLNIWIKCCDWLAMSTKSIELEVAKCMPHICILGWMSILLSAKHFMTSMETEHFAIECDDSYSAFFVLLSFFVFP